VIRVFVVDDHPALRTGLWTVIRGEPGMEFAGSAPGGEEALEGVRNMRPDVVLVDYQLQHEDGIALSRRLKSLPDPPNVLVFSAYSESILAINAILAGADGVTSKGVLADELLDTIRLVARGRRAMPPIPPSLLQASASRLDAEDLPIFSMMMDHTPLPAIADALGIAESELSARLGAMLGKLRVGTPARSELAAYAGETG
jgi:DNA-binding NarL/FixJ family response regulator